MLFRVALGSALVALFSLPAHADCQSTVEWAFKAGQTMEHHPLRYPVALEQWSGQVAQRIMDRLASIASKPPMLIDGMMVITGAPESVVVGFVQAGMVCIMVPMQRELYDRAVREAAGQGV